MPDAEEMKRRMNRLKFRMPGGAVCFICFIPLASYRGSTMVKYGQPASHSLGLMFRELRPASGRHGVRVANFRRRAVSKCCPGVQGAAQAAAANFEKGAVGSGV